MIIDNLKYSKQYEVLSEDFKKVFDLIRKLNSDSPLGKRVIEEGRVWLDVYEAPARDEVPEYEVHQEYIDIHYILSGKEEFGYSCADRLTMTKPYDQPTDLSFYDGEGDTFVMNEGDFCIVYPHDAHISFKKKLCDKPLIRVIAKIKSPSFEQGE